MRWLLRLVINAAALWIALRVVSGITYTGGWIGLLAVALIFGLVNTLIRPLIKLLTFPLVILTLGLFTFVINALMLLLTGWLAGQFDIGFHVHGFIPAFWAALVVTVVSWILSLLLPDRE